LLQKKVITKSTPKQPSIVKSVENKNKKVATVEGSKENN